MKQAQSGISSHLLAGRGRRWSVAAEAARPISLGQGVHRAGAGTGSDPLGSTIVDLAWWTGKAVVALVGAAWFLVALPFRLVFWLIALLGRITGVVIGFSLMVAGMFFLAGPFFLIGIPLFVVGLVLTLRCLE